MGLLELGDWKSSGHDRDYFLAWLPYLALTIVGLLARKRNLYFVMYSILCVLLLLNVVGCQKMIQGLNHIK